MLASSFTSFTESALANVWFKLRVVRNPLTFKCSLTMCDMVAKILSNKLKGQG